MNRTSNMRDASGFLAATLFMAQFLYLWVTVDPFPAETVSAGKGGANRLNQMAALLLFAGSVFYVAISPLRRLALQPWPLLALVIIWLLLTALFSTETVEAFKQAVLSVIILLLASVFLLLPRSEEQFAKMVMAGLLIMLGVAYFGVMFKPLQAIHQFSSQLGDEQLGNWRGHFAHKNVAAAAMLISGFYGLYLKDRGFHLAGWLILILSVIFLVHTGGKTSTAMFPMVLLIAYIFEKLQWLRWSIALGGVLVINFLTVGAALIPSVYELMSSLGVDASFTNRSDIWRLAVRAIADKPFMGHGLHGYWLTEALVNNDTVENWSPRAFNGHNAWVDTLINLGYVGFLLVFIWVLVLPLLYIRRITQRDLYSPVVRLYVRIWLYGLFASALESVFFETGSLLWFSIMMAIFGLRLQAMAMPATSEGISPLARASDCIGVKR